MVGGFAMRALFDAEGLVNAHSVFALSVNLLWLEGSGL